MNGKELDMVVNQVAQRLHQTPGFIRKNYELDYFSYVHEFLPLAASATQTVNFLVQADSGFAIVKTCGIVSSNVNVFVANITDTPRFTPFTLTWTDSGSGRDLMNAAVAFDNIVGSGKRPYYWPKPKILDPNSTFTGRIQNLVATAFNVRISYSGYKIFGNVDAFKRTH